MAGRQVQVGIGCTAYDRCAVGRHRSQPGPEFAVCHIGCAREQVGQHMVERAATGLTQCHAVAGQFGGSAHADAVAQPRDRHFVGLVHDGRLGRASGVVDRNGDRIALDWIDRNADADRLEHQGRIAAHGDQVGVRQQCTLVGGDAGDPGAVAGDSGDVDAIPKTRTVRLGQLRDVLRELEAVAGFVARQPQRPDELFLHLRQRGFDPDVAGAVEQLVGNAVLLKDLDVLAGPVELLLGPEQLQRAQTAFVVADAGVGTQGAQAIAAVFGQAHHAALVEGVPGLGAIAQHRQAPAPHRRVEHRPDHQRAVLHEHPLDGLERYAGAGPRRRITR